MKSKVHPTYKTKFRVANWPTYQIVAVSMTREQIAEGCLRH